MSSSRAVILGLALGDALGWPVEFIERPHILAKYGRQGITAPPDPAEYTDDTQMSLAVAEALIQAGNSDLDTLMNTLAKEFIMWKHDPITPTRAPGATCIRGVNALEFGAPWREAGVKGSKGCGSVMRVAPIGYYYQNDLTRLRSVARAQSLLTHRHPTAEAACIGAAYLVKLALDGVAPVEFPNRLLTFAGGDAPEFDDAVRRVIDALKQNMNDDTALTHIGPTRGGGWIAEEAVAMALYCVMRQPDNFAACVALAANINGDSDSVACIAGGISGARLGLNALPTDWLNRLENYTHLCAVADALATQRAAVNR